MEVSRVDRSPDPLELTRNLIMDSRERAADYQPQDLQCALNEMGEASKAFGTAVVTDLRLSYRLYSGLGYKTWSPEEFAKAFSSPDKYSDDFFFFAGLAGILATVLVESGFDPAKRSSFDQWATVETRALEALAAFRELDHYRYEVRIFLNGPPIDTDEDVRIAKLSYTKTETVIDVTISYATDDLLAPLVEYKPSPGFEKVNTVVRYEVEVPIEYGEETYLEEYPKASLVGDLVLDALRLTRPREDIGVLALEVVPTSRMTPHIRKTWPDRFQADLARMHPRRFDFDPVSPQALSENEIVSVREAISAIVSLSDQDWGLKHAISRFRNSYEKYSRHDPERLLEYAIALEALYLNDGSKDRGELTYRLSLRAARLLEKNLEKRKQIFNLMRELYSFRSRIAHGEDLTRTRKKRDNEELENVLDHAPEVVARSIIRLMSDFQSEDRGKPRSLDYWRAIELG